MENPWRPWMLLRLDPQMAHMAYGAIDPTRGLVRRQRGGIMTSNILYDT